MAKTALIVEDNDLSIKMIKAEDSLKKIPVIVVTALAMGGDEVKIRQGGCDGYIAEPISVPNFLKTVANYN